MKQRDSQKRIAFQPIQLFAEGADSAVLPDEIQVVPTGKWDHPAYGEMEITSDDISEFVKNFKGKVRRDIRITTGARQRHVWRRTASSRVVQRRIRPPVPRM